MKRAFVLLLLAGCGEHAHREPPPAAPAAPAANPVQHEMRLLTSALATAVSGIGSGDVRGLPHQLHAVHTAKEATEAAIREGRYQLQKGGSLDRFRALDEEFHGDLERLVRAAGENDVPATAAAFGGVMQRCQGCHSEFRR